LRYPAMDTFAKVNYKRVLRIVKVVLNLNYP